FDVLLLMTMMTRRFHLVTQLFMLFTSVLVIGILYQLIVIQPDLGQIAFHSVVPGSLSTDALLLVVGIIGATVMPHALFVHSWLSKNKMDLLGRTTNGGNLGSSVTESMKPTSNHHPFSIGAMERTRKFHLKETVIALTIASVVNAEILLVAIPLYPNPNVTVSDFVHGIGLIFVSA